MNDYFVDGVWFFPGTGPRPFDEALRKQFWLATEQIERGEAEMVESVDEWEPEA